MIRDNVATLITFAEDFVKAMGWAINRLATILFKLEMEGIVKSIAGGSYHLVQ